MGLRLMRLRRRRSGSVLSENRHGERGRQSRSEQQCEQLLHNLIPPQTVSSEFTSPGVKHARLQTGLAKDHKPKTLAFRGIQVPSVSSTKAAVRLNVSTLHELV